MEQDEFNAHRGSRDQGHRVDDNGAFNALLVAVCSAPRSASAQEDPLETRALFGGDRRVLWHLP